MVCTWAVFKVMSVALTESALRPGELPKALAITARLALPVAFTRNARAEVTLSMLLLILMALVLPELVKSASFNKRKVPV